MSQWIIQPGTPPRAESHPEQRSAPSLVLVQRAADFPVRTTIADQCPGAVGMLKRSEEGLILNLFTQFTHGSLTEALTLANMIPQMSSNCPFCKPKDTTNPSGFSKSAPCRISS